MGVVRQQYVIYQIELRVVKGIAEFDEAIPLNGLKSIRPLDGWVPLDVITGQIADEIGKEDEVTKNLNRVANCHPINGRGQSLNTRPSPQRKKIREDKTEDFRSPIDRAKTSFSYHQFHTLKKLERQGVESQLRMSAFERRETVMEINHGFNISIFDDPQEEMPFDDEGND